MTPAARIYVALPGYGGVIGTHILRTVFSASSRGYMEKAEPSSYSFLTHNFNVLFCEALNHRKLGFTHFAMCHDDCEPERGWLDKMVDIATERRADILSVVIPIKDEQGYTSTALDTLTVDPEWRVKRLTMTEIYRDYEPTFTHPKLLLNTGLMLVDLRKPAVEKLWFEFKNVIQKLPDGTMFPKCFPEDWQFSRMARREGLRLYATREIKVDHWGRHKYGNDKPWGTKQEDEA